MGDGPVSVAPMGIEAFGPIDFGDAGLNGGHVLGAVPRNWDLLVVGKGLYFAGYFLSAIGAEIVGARVGLPTARDLSDSGE